MFDVGLDPQALMASPKAAAKLLVVVALTTNGLALHALVFPMLRGSRGRDRTGATVPVILGAFSTASWLYASFIGASRLIAPSMSLAGYMALYGVLLVGAIACALVFVRPMVARLLPAPQ